jgi:hypothetical protein
MPRNFGRFAGPAALVFQIAALAALTIRTVAIYKK